MIIIYNYNLCLIILIYQQARQNTLCALFSRYPVVNVSLKGGDHLFENVLFKQITDFLEVSPGTADIEVSLADHQSVLLTIPDFKVEPNIIYTISILGYSTKDPKLEAVILTN